MHRQRAGCQTTRTCSLGQPGRSDQVPALAASAAGSPPRLAMVNKNRSAATPPSSHARVLFWRWAAKMGGLCPADSTFIVWRVMDCSRRGWEPQGRGAPRKAPPSRRRPAHEGDAMSCPAPSVWEARARWGCLQVSVPGRADEDSSQLALGWTCRASTERHVLARLPGCRLKANPHRVPPCLSASTEAGRSPNSHTGRDASHSWS